MISDLNGSIVYTMGADLSLGADVFLTNSFLRYEVEHLFVFLGKTLYSHSASLHPGVQMGTSKYARGNPAMD